MDSHKQTVILHGLKYATFTLGAVVILVGAVAIFNAVDSGALSGRLLKAHEKEIPRAFFTAQRAIEGFTAPADTHVVFTIPPGPKLPVIIFLGGPDYNEKIRYWYYCFSGNEETNKDDFLKGRNLYDGKLGTSKAERDAQRKAPPGNMDLLGIRDSENAKSEDPAAPEIASFKGGETCYLMTSAPLPVGVDSDGDGLNNAFERNIGTSPAAPDTDGDNIPDGREVFVTKTAPTLWDSDGDNMSDGFEDKDQDGPDLSETSATLADTDRDGLCDGDGRGAGCPEPRSYPFRGEDTNMNGVVDSGESDPRKADTDKDGINDLDERWDALSITP